MSTLTKQRNFKLWSGSIITTAFITQFIYSEMPSDLMNIYYTYFEAYGWSRTSIALPNSISAYLGILLIFCASAIMMRYDYRKILSGCVIVVGVTTIVIGYTQSYPVYFISYLLTNLCSRVAILAVQGIVTNWYITTRGRVMGFYTIAAPLGTAFFPNFLTRMLALTDMSNIWLVVGIIIIGIGIVFLFSVRKSPEELGLTPDGKVYSEEEMAALNTQEESQWNFARIVRCKEAWLLGIGTGCWMIVMSGFMGIFVPRMMELGFTTIEAVNRLSIASLLGIVLSIIWGYVDDFFGTPKAGAILGVGYFLMSLTMWLAGFIQNSLFIWIAVIGVAMATGGIPNLQPSSYAYVFGRKQFMFCNKYVQPLMIIISAPFSLIFNMIYDATGSYNPSYIVCMVASVISIICYLNIKTTYDPERLAIKDAVK